MNKEIYLSSAKGKKRRNQKETKAQEAKIMSVKEVTDIG